MLHYSVTVCNMQNSCQIPQSNLPFANNGIFFRHVHDKLCVCVSVNLAAKSSWQLEQLSKGWFIHDMQLAAVGMASATANTLSQRINVLLTCTFQIKGMLKWSKYTNWTPKWMCSAAANSRRVFHIVIQMGENMFYLNQISCSALFFFFIQNRINWNIGKSFMVFQSTRTAFQAINGFALDALLFF